MDGRDRCNLEHSNNQTSLQQFEKCKKLMKWRQVLSISVILIALILDSSLLSIYAHVMRKGHFRLATSFQHSPAGWSFLKFFLVVAFFRILTSSLWPLMQTRHSMRETGLILGFIYSLCWGITTTYFFSCVYAIMVAYKEKIKEQYYELIVKDLPEFKLEMELPLSKFSAFTCELTRMCSLHANYFLGFPLMVCFGILLYWIVSIVLMFISVVSIPVALLADSIFITSTLVCLYEATTISSYTREVACQLLHRYASAANDTTQPALNLQDSLDASIRKTAMLLDSQTHEGFKIFETIINLGFLVQLATGALGMAFTLVGLAIRDLGNNSL